MHRHYKYNDRIYKQSDFQVIKHKKILPHTQKDEIKGLHQDDYVSISLKRFKNLPYLIEGSRNMETPFPFATFK